MTKEERKREENPEDGHSIHPLPLETGSSNVTMTRCLSPREEVISCRYDKQGTSCEILPCQASFWPMLPHHTLQLKALPRLVSSRKTTRQACQSRRRTAKLASVTVREANNREEYDSSPSHICTPSLASRKLHAGREAVHFPIRFDSRALHLLRGYAQLRGTFNHGSIRRADSIARRILVGASGGYMR
jgi:hypothetical protein